MIGAYQEFIDQKSKRLRARVQGIEVAEDEIHPALYPFQRAITRRALQLGNAALFEDCGMGKTIQELEWARHVTATNRQACPDICAVGCWTRRWLQEGQTHRPEVLSICRATKSDINGPISGSHQL